MADPTDAAAIACSLTDAEFRARRALARETLLPHVLATERLERGLKLSFPESQTMRSRVESFVSLERRCCGFLKFTVSPPDDGLALTIEAPTDARATLEKYAADLTAP